MGLARAVVMVLLVLVVSGCGARALVPTKETMIAAGLCVAGAVAVNVAQEQPGGTRSTVGMFAGAACGFWGGAYVVHRNDQP